MTSVPELPPNSIVPPPEVPPTRKRRFQYFVAIVFVLVNLWAAYEWWSLPDVTSFKTENPKTTALIESRANAATKAKKKPRRFQSWVRLESLPKHVVDAVLMSEDANFYGHNGVDFDELSKAIHKSIDTRKSMRGASTITQQVAKNLWLSESRSYFRKFKEYILARRIEENWGKKRILAVYLNIAEWGDGVYGIEAAARTHFQTSSAQLSIWQAAVLASMLPAPRKWVPGAKSARLYQRAERLLDVLANVKRISMVEKIEARGQLDAFFGKATNEAPEDDSDDEESE